MVDSFFQLILQECQGKGQWGGEHYSLTVTFSCPAPDKNAETTSTVFLCVLNKSSMYHISHFIYVYHIRIVQCVVCMCICLYLYLYFYISISLYLYISISLSLSFFFFLFLSIPISISICFHKEV